MYQCCNKCCRLDHAGKCFRARENDSVCTSGWCTQQVQPDRAWKRCQADEPDSVCQGLNIRCEPRIGQPTDFRHDIDLGNRNMTHGSGWIWRGGPHFWNSTNHLLFLSLRVRSFEKPTSGPDPLVTFSFHAVLQRKMWGSSKLCFVYIFLQEPSTSLLPVGNWSLCRSFIAGQILNFWNSSRRGNGEIVFGRAKRSTWKFRVHQDTPFLHPLSIKRGASIARVSVCYCFHKTEVLNSCGKSWGASDARACLFCAWLAIGPCKSCVFCLEINPSRQKRCAQHIECSTAPAVDVLLCLFAQVRDLSRFAREAMGQVLDSIEWMDEPTRAVAKRKVCCPLSLSFWNRHVPDAQCVEEYASTECKTFASQQTICAFTCGLCANKLNWSLWLSAVADAQRRSRSSRLVDWRRQTSSDISWGGCTGQVQKTHDETSCAIMLQVSRCFSWRSIQSRHWRAPSQSGAPSSSAGQESSEDLLLTCKFCST